MRPFPAACTPTPPEGNARREDASRAGRFGRGPTVVLVAVSLLVLVSGARGRAGNLAPVQASPELLRDNSYCLGCHGAGAHTRAPRVDVEALHASVHRGLACVDCHTAIEGLPHRKGPPADCGRCHGGGVDRALLSPRQGRPGDRHERVPAGANGGRPTCAVCHGGHGVLAVSRADSSVGAKHVAATCHPCHPQIAEEYAASIHGQAASRGNKDVPTCATCHPEHANPVKEGVQRKGIVGTCVSCHEDPGLESKYALPANRLSSYLGSYHGAAAVLGDSRTANCASCHGVHNILPSSDPRATINRAHLAQTCGKCHPGASFASGTIHLQPTRKRDRIQYSVSVAYQLFIGGMMASFLGYITLDLRARRRRRLPASHRPRPGEVEPEYERLSLNQRVQHWLLITCFITLMGTGLPLAAPRSPLSRGVINLLGGMGARAMVHRGAALALVLLVLYHAGYVLLSRRGRWEFRQLRPGRREARELYEMLRFYLGFSGTRARFGRYNFIEKFEYLAVGWGSVVMIGTGALLWNPGLSLAVVPKWVMDVAFIVHSWEAILAFLAIIVWHMYNVHFNPAIFPMSRVWLTGRISLHELQENHPREYEEYARAPVPAGRERG